MSHFELTGNPNYAAMVVEYSEDNVVPLEGRDRVVGYKVLGYQSIIQKGLYVEGQPLVVFGAETQLSHEMAHHSNLYRHEQLNENPTERGYLDDNRRVRAIKFAGHRSDALVMPLDSLLWAWKGDALALAETEVGTGFDHIDGHEICRKYALPVKGNGASMSNRQGQKKVRVQTHMFPEHFDTMNGFRNVDMIESDEFVVVTQKLHGTSVRLARVPVARDLRWFERLAKKLGVLVQEHEHGVVVGSRRVTKSINGEVEGEKNHFYGATDIWTEATQDMHALIPENFAVFAEIIGWTPDGAEIQPKYTYNVPAKRQAVYVYRVATINGQGDLVDLPWRAVERFCEARGWKTVPVLAAGFWTDLQHDIDTFMDTRYADAKILRGSEKVEHEFPTAVPLSNPKTVDEGVCVRTDSGFTPTVIKFKSPVFLGHETALLDQNVADIEATQAEYEVAA